MSSQPFDTLAAAESKLAREQVEYDKLVSQLMALRDESQRVEGELGSNGTTATTTRVVKVPVQLVSTTTTTNPTTPFTRSASAARGGGGGSTPSARSSPTHTPQQQQQYSVPMPDRAAPIPPSQQRNVGSSSSKAPPQAPPTTSSSSYQPTRSASAARSTITTNSSFGGPAVATTPSSSSSSSSSSNYPSAPKSVMSGSGHSLTRSVSPARSTVTYRSSIYRSSSPSKAVKNGVVISNFGRSARFREEKTDVPGPGKYQPHATDFAPVAVVRGTDDEGKLGHTHSTYNQAIGARPSLQQQHADAMVAATARIQPAYILNSNSGSNRQVNNNNPLSPSGESTATFFGAGGAGSPNTVGTSASGLFASSSSTTAGFDSHAKALVASFHGDTMAALEATLKREKQLKKEAMAARDSANTIRLETSRGLSTLTNETETLRATLRKREEKITSLSNKLHQCSDIFMRAEEAMSALGRALAESAAAASAVGHRNPALAQALEKARILEGVVRSGYSLMAVASGGGGGGSSGSSIAGSDIGERGFTSYSSLTAAVNAPETSNFGTLGGSEKVIFTQNTRTNLAATSTSIAPPQLPRERHLTGAQQRGIAPGQDNASRGISASAIAAFAQRAAGAVSSTDSNAVLKAIRGGNNNNNNNNSSNNNGTGRGRSASPAAAGRGGGWGGDQHSPSSSPRGGQNNKNSSRDISALLANFSDDFLQPNVLSFVNTHKGALLSMFSRYAAGTARMTRAAVDTFARDYRIVPSALSTDEVARLATEVLRTSGREGPDAALAYPEFVELLGLLAYVAAAGTYMGREGVNMLTKLHAFMAGCAERNGSFTGAAELNLVIASREAMKVVNAAPVDRAREVLLGGGR